MFRCRFYETIVEEAKLVEVIPQPRPSRPGRLVLLRHGPRSFRSMPGHRHCCFSCLSVQP